MPDGARLSPEQWEQVRVAFERVTDRLSKGEERSIESIDSSDPTVKAEVVRLLKWHGRLGAFIEPPTKRYPLHVPPGWRPSTSASTSRAIACSPRSAKAEWGLFTKPSSGDPIELSR